MASIEDKILGGPRENYCSSDEGEPDDQEESPKTSSRGKGPTINPVETGIPPPQGSKWGGYSVNTGPKGVLRDWELYKAQEEEMRKAKDAELIAMVKASSITCRTEAQDARAAQVVEKITEELGNSDDLDELLMSDAVLEEFVKQRMNLMLQSENPNSGTAIGYLDLKTGDDFLQVVDSSSPTLTVVIHIYDDKTNECARMNEALSTLSQNYGSTNVQFCKIRADTAGVSGLFKAKGIPALLVYKGGNLIGNFVQIKEELGSDFYAGDVENFLIEHGMIQDKNDIPALIAKAKQRLKD